MELRIINRISHTSRVGFDQILQYRDMDKWVDGSTTNNGKWVHGEWKDVPNLEWVDE